MFYVALSPTGTTLAFGEDAEQLVTGLDPGQHANIYQVTKTDAGPEFKLVKTVGVPDILERSRWVEPETSGWRLMIVTKVMADVVEYLDVYEPGAAASIFKRSASRKVWEDDITLGRLRPVE